MAAMIWDTEAQAFTEAEIPMKYDTTAESWTDTTGLAWDTESEAWTEKWSSFKGFEGYIIKSGVFQSGISLNILKGGYGNNQWMVSSTENHGQSGNYYYFKQNTGDNYGYYGACGYHNFFTNFLPLHKGSKLHIKGYANFGVAHNNLRVNLFLITSFTQEASGYGNVTVYDGIETTEFIADNGTTQNFDLTLTIPENVEAAFDVYVGVQQQDYTYSCCYLSDVYVD